jgi:ELWxxDGT repeat protein
VNDINPGESGSYPYQFTNVNGTLYFIANDLLYKSDGTAAGTVQLAQDIYPNGLVNGNGVLFFSGSDASGYGLFKLDATGNVVRLPGTENLSDYPYNLVYVNGSLFFSGGDDAHGYELWKSNGTTAALVNDINPGPGGSDPQYLTAVGNTVYFAAGDPAHGNELWRSDGTAAGTVLVQDITPGVADTWPANLTNVNGTLFFTAYLNDHDTLWAVIGTGAPVALLNDGDARELTNVNGILFFNDYVDLWRSDGTPNGTTVVKDNVYPNMLTNVNGILFFEGWDSDHGYELWKSDGTATGTILVKDINPGPPHGNPGLLTNMNGTIFFTATEPSAGTQLWKSNGTAAGTVLVRNISPGTADSSLANFADVNGTLFFSAYDVPHGVELWKSNGTVAGTVMVQDIVSGAGGSNPTKITDVNGTLFFVSGFDLWKTDGTPTGATLVKGGVNPDMPVNVNGTLLFVGWDSVRGVELWKSDGTAAGTVMVKDINPGGGSHPDQLVVLNGVLFFTADDGTNGRRLWTSDGTAEGTMRLRSDIPIVYELIRVNTSLYFTIFDAGSLWVSDGSAANTTMLQTGITPSKLTAVGNTLFFQGWSQEFGDEIWKSDGTSSGTVMVKHINPGIIDSFLENFTNVNGTLYFTGWYNGGTTPHLQLWKSDGTESGTIPVIDFPSDSSITSLASVHGILAFVFDDGVHGAELWTSNGTAAGTGMVQDIYPGPSGSSLMQLYMANATTNVLNEALFFSAIDPLAGRELFILDFTPPTSTISSPLNGAYLRGPMTITGASGDSLPGSGVNLVQVSTDNGTSWHTATDVSGNGSWTTWQYNWTPLPADGVYVVKCRATDRATNMQITLPSISVTVDNTAPTSTISQPAYLNAASATVSGTAGDNLSGVSMVEVSSDGGQTWHSATDTSGNGSWAGWQYNWTPLPVDGTYVIKSRAIDRSGNVQSPVAIGTVIIDNISPLSTIAQPTNGTYFHVTSTTISGTAADDRSGVVNVEVSINNGVWQTTAFTAGSGTWQLTGTLPAVNGSYTIRSRATDRSGNVQSPATSITIIIDNTPHPLVIDLAGSGGGTVHFVEKNMVCGNDCQTTVYAGDHVTLQAAADQYSLFGGWAGACSGSGVCNFSMPGAATTTATATFSIDSAHAVQVGSNYFTTIIDGYQAAPTGAIIKIWGINFIETLLFDQNKKVVLRGGDNGTHTSNSDGMTTVKGTLKIRRGSITVNKVKIR